LISLSYGVSTRNASKLPFHGNDESKIVFIERFGLTFLILRFVFNIFVFYQKPKRIRISPEVVATDV